MDQLFLAINNKEIQLQKYKAIIEITTDFFM